MEIRYLAQIKKVVSAGLLILGLLGCSKEEIPENIELSYPYFLASTDNARVVIEDKGKDPIVVFEILRRASESLESYELTINRKNIPAESVTVTAGRVWDTDEILPEGVIDLFSSTITEEGNITVSLAAKYNSGQVYNNVISFEYGYN